MKDMWGKEAKMGDIFVHPRRVSSSLWMNKYEIVSVDKDFVKAKCLNKNSYAYKVFVYNPDGVSYYRDMTEAERAKVDTKIVKITTFSARSTIL
jgi:hypothetical protein